MVSRPFTDAHLRGPYQGQKSELWVLTRLTELGWEICWHNQKVLKTQIDLLARNPEGYLFVVEVKSRRFLEFGGLSRRQSQRLKQVVLWLNQKEPTGLIVAIPDLPNLHLFEIQD